MWAEAASGLRGDSLGKNKKNGIKYENMIEEREKNGIKYKNMIRNRIVLIILMTGDKTGRDMGGNS